MLKCSIRAVNGEGCNGHVPCRLLIQRNLSVVSPPTKHIVIRIIALFLVCEGAALANAGRPHQCSAHRSRAGVQISDLRTSNLHTEPWHHPPAGFDADVSAREPTIPAHAPCHLLACAQRAMEWIRGGACLHCAAQLETSCSNWLRSEMCCSSALKLQGMRG